VLNASEVIMAVLLILSSPVKEVTKPTEPSFERKRQVPELKQ
jgi:hypothetical protein